MKQFQTISCNDIQLGNCHYKNAMKSFKNLYFETRFLNRFRINGVNWPKLEVGLIINKKNLGKKDTIFSKK